MAARAIARRRAENTLIADLDPEKLQMLDRLLEVDVAIGQTRFPLAAFSSGGTRSDESRRIDRAHRVPAYTRDRPAPAGPNPHGTVGSDGPRG